MSDSRHGTAPPEADAHQHDLGVLLVHGIGEQKQGETLNEFGAPIIKWLDQWLEDDVVEVGASRIPIRAGTKDFFGRATFTRGTLRPPDLSWDTPAHAAAALDKGPDGIHRERQSWLFAESWWSPQTLTPRVSPFLLWLITRGPWVLLLHLSQSLCVDFLRMSRQMTRQNPASRAFRAQMSLYGELLRFALATTAWLLVSLLLITLWCVVSLIALVPVGYVRKRVYDLLQALTGVIGDSYVLINDPIQRAAFGTATRRALAWLRAQGCRKVAVVAHSQGAAVARDVLFEPQALRVDCFVTLGPGIAKLDALADRERRAPQDFLWCGAAAPLTLLAVLAFVRLSAGGHSGFALWGFPLLAGVVAAVAILRSWHSVADGLKRLEPDDDHAEMLRRRQPRLRWHDYFASHDPVSHGSLAPTVAAGLRWVVSRRVMVLASRLQDHTSYWSSRADFLPRVAQALDRCAGSRLFATARGTQRLRTARANHARCVRFLGVLRWLALVAMAIPLLRFGRVQAAADGLKAWLLGFEIRSVGSVVGAIDGVIGWAGTQIAGRPYDGSHATAFLLLAAVVAVVLHVWGRIVAYWWGHMAAWSLAPVFVPSRTQGARTKQMMLAALVAALGLLPLGLAMAWTFAPDSINWRSLDAVMALLAQLAVLMLYLALLATAALEAWELAPKLRTARQAHGSWRAALGHVPGLWFLLVFVVVFVAGGALLLRTLL